MQKITKNSSESNFNKLLETSKLSRREPLPKNSAIVCVGCGERLDSDDNLQQSVRGCRKCLGIYARIDLSIDEAEKLKRREKLEKFLGGVK